MKSILVETYSLFRKYSQTRWQECENLRNTNAHPHPAFVDALELIGRWVRSENEQERLLENLFFLSKKSYNRHISTMST